MSIQISLYRVDFGSYLTVATSRFILVIFVLATTSFTMVICSLGSSVTSIRLLGYFFYHGVDIFTDGDYSL
jgi:DMSO/TMAO reductase YedYZ heme-binding membrane subunit